MAEQVQSPETCLESFDLGSVGTLIESDSDRYHWYDVGDMDLPGSRPAVVPAGKFANSHNVLVRLCLSQHWVLLRFDLRALRVYLFDSKWGYIPSVRLAQAIAAIGTAIWGATGSGYMEPWWSLAIMLVPQQLTHCNCCAWTMEAALGVSALDPDSEPPSVLDRPCSETMQLQISCAYYLHKVIQLHLDASRRQRYMVHGARV
jgi:hypothetical protein